MDPYATHQKFLEYYIKKTSGDIIEFGTGHGSTGFILKLISGTDRKLLSLENDRSWYDKMVGMYPESENHKYIFVNDWKEELINWIKISIL
jgi:phospholipid N-methyltransferase